MRTSGDETVRRASLRVRRDGVPVPPRTYVAHAGLRQRLDAATTRPVTVLVAPAGSGKTSALAHWAAESDRSPFWLDARGGDRPEVLARALLDSAGVSPRRGTPSDPGGVVRLLDGASDAPSVLVLDDAHLLGAAAWQLLDAVLARAPTHVHLVVATRRDVPLATVALALTDEITVLRADALRLDDAEARALIVAHAPDVSAEDVDTLQSRVHGWAAALVLGAHSLGGAADRSAARAALALTDQPVLDYLLGEVFATLPAATRHVLLCTAADDVVTDSSAEILSGDTEAATRLAGLAVEGFLVTGYEAEGDGQAWRYHPLLRELLRRQVAVDGADHVLAVAAHARAAHHFALHGPHDLAVHHAAVAREHQLLVSLLLEHGPGLLCRGQETAVDAGLQVLLDTRAEEHPGLLAVAALHQRSVGDLADAVRLATITARHAKRLRAELADGRSAATPEQLALLADSALLNAWLARFGWHDVQDAIDEARLVLGCDHRAGSAEREGSHSLPCPLAPARLAWLLHELAVVETWAGELEVAAGHADEALEVAQAVGIARLEAASLADICVLQLLDGQAQTAAATAVECLDAALRSGRQEDGYISRPHLALAWAAFNDLRLDDAADSLAEVERAVAHSSDPLVSSLALVLETRLRAERGDLLGARRLAASSAVHPEPAPAYLDGLLAAARAHAALISGDASDARRQLPALKDVGWRVGELAVWAGVDELVGNPEAALRRLDQALRLPTSGGQDGFATFAAAVKARLHLDRGERPEARAALRDALTRAAPQRLLHPLLAGATGPAADALLVELASGPDAHPFAAAAVAARRRRQRPVDHPGPVLPGQRTGLVRRTGPAPQPAAATIRASSAPLPPQPLTGREAEVLRELALGGSYQDVARSLFVTENTVKTHVSALYRKLGVDRRSDALRRAREHGLL